jgi:signal transduction histidine kinase
MRQLPDISPIVDIACIITPDHEFLCVNEEAAQQHGMCPEDFVGERCYELVHDQDEPICECPCAETIETGRPKEGEVFEENGRSYVPAAAPIFGDGEEIVAIAHTIRDVTEQREREAELNRKNERLENLASTIAHDLRNSLTVAKGRAALAQETGNCEHLDDVAASIDRNIEIVEDLLTFAQSDYDRGDTERIELSTAASDCWERVFTAAAELIVVSDLVVEAAPRRFSQLLENLFRNAVQHGGPAVTVRLGALDERPGFYLADDGPGIAPDQREAVFEAGYSTADSGTGLGLNIAAEAAAAHGWTIAATESEAGGARFEIVLDESGS